MILALIASMTSGWLLDSMTARSFATSLSPLETDADYIFFFLLLLSDEINLSCLVSKPQVLENCPVLGSRTALFFEWLKFCGSAKKCFSRPFFSEIAEKKILKTFFFGKHLHFVSLVLASSIPVLSLGLGFFCVLGLGLEPCFLDSTSGNNLFVKNTAYKSIDKNFKTWLKLSSQN